MSENIRYHRPCHHHYHQDELLNGHGVGGSCVGEKIPRSAKAGCGFLPDPEYPGRDLAMRARSEGRGRFRKTMHVCPVPFEFDHDGWPLEHSFAVESRRGTTKTSRMPIKALINEKMSKGTEARRKSPNLVARLMGLDTLPPQNVPKQSERSGGHLRKSSSWGSQGNWVTYEGYCHSMSNDYDDDEQEFKDVYEVLETSEVQTVENQEAQTGKLESRLKQYEVDMAYVRKKYLNTKRLSTDEALSSSNELDDAKDVLDNSNKDKFLGKPTSLFSKHLHDLKRSPPSPKAHHITILKSSAGPQGRGEKCDKSERKVERRKQMPEEVMSSFVRPLPTLSSHHLKERFPKSKHFGEYEDGSDPTRIVVLKPSLDKPLKQKSATLPSSKPEDYIFVHGRHWDQELYSEGKARQNASDKIKQVLPRPKSYREIAKEMTMQMRDAATSSNGKMFSSGFNGSIREKISCSMLDMDDLNNSRTFRWSADDFNEWDFNSSPYSDKSSVSREARRRLSDRWKTAHRFEDADPFSGGSSTLAEMLAFSNRETMHTNLCTVTCPNISAGNMPHCEASAACGCPSSINSSSGWKHDKVKPLVRSTSLPASSNLFRSYKRGGRNHLITNEVENQYGCLSHKESPLHRGSAMGINSKHHSYESYPCKFDGEHNKPPEREIHVNEEVLSSNPRTHHSEKKAVTSELSDGNDLHINHLDEGQNVLSEHVEVNGLPLVSDQTESVAAEIHKKFDGPSPVSVLKPLEEEKMDSECFEKINADLKELRLQLQLLKMDSSGPYVEDLEAPTVSDDDQVVCNSQLQMAEILPEYRDKIDMEYSYLLDILIVSGIHCSNWNTLSCSIDLDHDSLSLQLFEHLETKYSKLSRWSESDRKLLFDLVNRVCAEKVASCSGLNAYVNSKRLMPESAHNVIVEDLWQMVAKNRRELKANQENLLDPSWLILGNDMDALGKEIARKLEDELLKEIISEMCSVSTAVFVRC